MRCDRVWRNARLATLAADRPGLGVVEHGLLAATAGRIVYAGQAASAPSFAAAELSTARGAGSRPA